MPDLNSLFTQLDEVYARCQPMPVKGERYYCVSPHLTFAEFLYLLRYLKENWTTEQIAEFAHRKPVFSLLAPGEADCPLSRSGGCLAEARRGMNCRVCDLPASSDPLYKVACVCGEKPAFDAKLVEEALLPQQDTLADMNAALHPFMIEPYFLDALTIECWFAVLLDPEIAQPVFLELRKIAAGVLDLAPLAAGYVNHTMFKEKLDAIDLFFSLNERQMAKEAVDCLKLIHDGFSATGGYYRPQAIIYARFLMELLQQKSGSVAK